MSLYTEDVVLHRGRFSVKNHYRAANFLGDPKGSSLVGGQELEYLRVDFLTGKDDDHMVREGSPDWLCQESFPKLTTLCVGQRQLNQLERLRKRFPKVEVLEVIVFGAVVLLHKSPFSKMVFIGRPLKHPHVSVTVNSPLEYLEVYGAAVDVDLHLWTCPRALKLGARVRLMEELSLDGIEFLHLGCRNVLEDFSRLESLRVLHIRHYIDEVDPSSLTIPKPLEVLGIDTLDPLQITVSKVDHLLLGRNTDLWREPVKKGEVDFSTYLTLNCIPRKVTGQSALLRRGNVIILPREATYLVELPNSSSWVLDWLDQNTVCYQTNIPDVYQVTSGRILTFGQWTLV